MEKYSTNQYYRYQNGFLLIFYYLILFFYLQSSFTAQSSSLKSHRIIYKVSTMKHFKDCVWNHWNSWTIKYKYFRNDHSSKYTWPDLILIIDEVLMWNTLFAVRFVSALSHQHRLDELAQYFICSFIFFLLLMSESSQLNYLSLCSLCSVSIDTSNWSV